MYWHGAIYIANKFRYRLLNGYKIDSDMMKLNASCAYAIARNGIW